LNIPDKVSSLLQQYFDKLLIVSIPRFTERHARVQNHLQGLPFDFFWGADKLQLDLDKAKQDGVYDEEITKQLQRQGKLLSPGELACSLSHRMVYEAMIKNNWDKVLILEDDVLPLYENLVLLPEVLNELPANWELVYFGYLYKIQSLLGLMTWSYKMISNMLPKPYSTHLKKAGFHDCTHAYAITLSGAKKLLAAQTPVVYRADDLLSHIILKGELNAFVTEPKFFDQEIFHNTHTASEIR